MAKAIIVTERDNKVSVRFTDNMQERVERLKIDRFNLLFVEDVSGGTTDKISQLRHALVVAQFKPRNEVVITALNTALQKLIAKQKKLDRKLYV